MDVYKEIIHNHQFKCLSAGGRISKLWYIHPYSGILLRKKKEWTTDIYNNMDETQICMLSVRRQTQRAAYVYESICLTHWKE